MGASLATAAGLLTPFLLDVDPALAGNPLLTGKTVSLIHPAVMLFLFGSTAWTGWLGWQWRRARTIPAEVKELKAQLPKPDAEGNRPSSPLEQQIAELEETRKVLTKGGYRDKHWNWGSLLLGLGVLIAIEGPVNTYLRTGKLFPGPHLYAGAAIVVLWASASALVPSMQKGNDTARNTHIALNTLNLALFAWQVPTGFEIVQKVWEFAPWP
ncbi:hypothetical protein COCSUDRAFT_14062 [Coccomyxa subellipsoidea C-169]|uniref:Uncharacterized protein n=1 Tax=Coccomyxa subellipsoidea (strain C-169) TaxID=574566 RepID=I0Z2R7_COCSC|nr:hypothetical protein COCSUDRAFT_14062 [Coccomyxa subellipsoidea C-169]EIE24936.1 hypothetical protein COCSUDRAFT_14062 [Coccomyxa subellipsoidea C-169]|eukprot:XP_005649480.1 hypothetical protein COCSUDRAFT_14062 [Coccomyxa subellipsoidea C-169]